MSKLVRDVICVNNLDDYYLQHIAERSLDIFKEMQTGNPNSFRNALAGEKVVFLFTQQSTRTWDSFWDAMTLLGAERIAGMRDAKESSLDKGESIYHTVDTYVGQGVGAKFIVMRDGLEGSSKWAQVSAFRSYTKKVKEFSKMNRAFPVNLNLPLVFNGGDGMHSHPSQLVLYCASIYNKFGKIKGINFGETNDLGGSRVVSSHIDAASMLDWTLHFCPLPGGELNQRQLYSLSKNKSKFNVHDNLLHMLPNLDLLYVSRYQFNLRGQKIDATKEIFTPEHPRITLDLILPHNLPVFHARPIDKNLKEIDSDLYDHPLDYSGIQSDFGVPARMAMAMYALNNRMFSLESIIKSLNPEEIGFFKENLQATNSKQISGERYTTAHVDNGYAIDHIPMGCGGVMANLITKVYPNIQVVVSMNVKGDYSNSKPKDVIKLHTPQNFVWDNFMDNLVAMFSEYTQKKSCRVSKFVGGKRIEKWSYKVLSEPQDNCINPKCVTRPEYKEDIYFKHKSENGIFVCPYCEMPQNFKI